MSMKIEISQREQHCNHAGNTDFCTFHSGDFFKIPCQENFSDNNENL